MKKDLYREAVLWIALNDDSGSPMALSAKTIAGYITTVLIADLFEKSPAVVARDILKIRKANQD